MPKRLRWVLIGFSAFCILGAVLALVMTAPRLAGIFQVHRIADDTTIAYLLCGHTAAAGKADPAVLAMMAGRKPGAKIGEWLLAEEKGRLRLIREIASLCPVCSRARFLGIADGFVAVFRGTPRHRGEILQVTRIPAAELPKAEYADLQAGIPVQDENERLRLMEGLSALVQ